MYILGGSVDRGPGLNEHVLNLIEGTLAIIVKSLE
jgi:hypothetical protein